jgi:predicted Fe-Mo cluster-binding NifX family protein
MRYAVPVSDGIISPHFGHCEYFAFYDVDEKSREITGKENIPSPEHQPGLLPAWLAENGVNIVIAGGMGPRAVDIFNQNRIDVVIGAAESDPEQAVISHLKGALATGDNICDHE